MNQATDNLIREPTCPIDSQGQEAVHLGEWTGEWTVETHRAPHEPGLETVWTYPLGWEEAPWHDHIRRAGVRLFNDLNEAAQSVSSSDALNDIVRTCDWLLIRIGSLRERLLEGAQSTPPPVASPRRGTGLGARVRPRDRRIGLLGAPAWAIADYLDEGLSHEQVASLWRGMLTEDDIREAERAVAEDRSVVAEMDSED